MSRRAGTDTLFATQATVAGPRGLLLPPTSLELPRGQVLVAVGDPGHGHTALALALSGRLQLDGGRVALASGGGAAALQKRVALVDVPGVSEPDASVPLATTVGEELAMAGRSAGRRTVHRWLDDRDLGHLARRRMEDIAVPDRTRVLAELAGQRPGVRFLVVTLPERHGGTPRTWLPCLQELADQGRGVLVTAGPTVAPLLGLPTTIIGSEEDA